MPAVSLTFFAVSAVASIVIASMLAARLVPMLEIAPHSRRIGHLDGLRGYLAFSVLLHHASIYVGSAASGREWVTPAQAVLSQLGAGAVALFFMVSGTVFYSFILKGLSADWAGFIVKRVFRILPMVTLSVTLVVLILMAVSGRSPGSDDVAPFLIWVSTWHQPPLLGIEEAKYLNAQVLWSLNWEWSFYFLIMPLCALLRDVLGSRGLPTLFIPISLFVLSLAGRLLDAERETMTGATWWNTLPLFAAGMLAYECWSRPAWREFLGRQASSAVGVACLLVAISFSGDAYGWSMPLFAFFFLTVTCGNSIGGLLQTRAALALGELSFSVYVLHGLVLWIGVQFVASVAGPGAVPILLLLPMLAALTVFIAVLANRGVERPTQLAGEKLAGSMARHRKGLMIFGFVRSSSWSES